MDVVFISFKWQNKDILKYRDFRFTLHVVIHKTISGEEMDIFISYIIAIFALLHINISNE